MKQMLIFLGLATVLAGCATTQSLNVSQRSRTYKADYSTTMKGCVTYCEVQGFPLQTVNEKMGIMSTDYRENDGTSKFFFGNVRAKITFNLHAVDSASTKVVANIVSEQEKGNVFFRSYSAATMTGGQATNIYTSLFDAIQVCLDNKNDIDAILKSREAKKAIASGDTIGTFGVNFHNRTVTSVINGSPADQAGIQRGDVIVSVDGVPLLGHDTEDGAILEGKIGSTADVLVQRGDRKRNFTLTRKSLQEL
jgi:hypothetical protein